MSNVGQHFQSKYVGICPRCRSQYEANTFIVRIPDEEFTMGMPGKYAHADPNECTALDVLEGKPTKWDGSTLEDMGY
jgi:hypothetical protein